MANTGSITGQLAEEIVATRFEDLPQAAVDKLKLVIMDNVGCAYLSYKVMNKYLVDFAKVLGGPPESTLIADGNKVACSAAADVNAQMAADANYEETGPGIHAFSSMGQTALAVGERIGASGKDILTAIAVAYEANGRFARNLKDTRISVHLFPAQTRRHLVLNTAICAAKLLGLNRDQVNQAISIAWMFTPPDELFVLTKLSWMADEWLWIPSLGIQAALMAQVGPIPAEAPVDILDKDGGEVYNLEKLIRSPSPCYYVLNELNLKHSIGSYGMQGALELIASMFQKEKIQPDEVERIVFRGSHMYTMNNLHGLELPNIKNPRTFLLSLPWNFTLAALGYTAGLDWVDPAKLKDPVIVNLAKKVKVEEAESALVNEIEIKTTKKTYKERIMRKDFFGSAGRPMPREYLETKFIRLTKPVIGEQQARKMVEIFSGFEKLDNIKALTRLYAPQR